MSSRSERVGGFTRGSGKRGSGGRFSSHYSGRSANLDSQNSRRDYDGDNHSRFRSHNSRGGYHNVSPDRRHSERGMNYHSHYSGKTSSGVRVPGGSEDPQLSTLWTKLETAQDAEQCHRIAQQIKNITEQHENKQTVGRLAEQAFTSIDRVLVEWDNRGLRDTLSRIMGHIGVAMGPNAQRYFHWILVRSNVTTSGDVYTKAVYLNGLHHTLSSDSDISTFAKSIPNTLESLQRYLEAVESPVLLGPLVKCLVEIGKNYRQYFGQYFKNTVDILVGWHIDTTQEPSLLDFVSNALQSFTVYWVNDMQFTLDLMNQFLEDMEAYSVELSGGDGEFSQDEPSTPDLCMNKLIVLIKVFTTVVMGLGDHFSPSRGYGITSKYVTDVISRLLKSISIANDCLYSEELLIAANSCFHALCKCLEVHFSPSVDLMLDFVLHQFNDTDSYSEAHTLSASQLILLIAESLQTGLPLSFIQHVLDVNSPILQFRYSASQKLMDTLIKLYQTLFSIRKIPLLDVCYQLVNADLDTAMKDLLRVLETHSTLPSSKEDSGTNHRNLSPYEAQGAVVFDLAILSQLLAATKSAMGMWVPKPSLHTLVTSHLATLNPTLACEYPAVHYALLHTLYQECQSHGYYIPGAASPLTIGSTPLLLVDPNASGSLSEILLLLTKQLEHYTLSTDICCLILKWLENMVELIMSSREKDFAFECQHQLDALTLQLLSFTFSREHSIRLETASLLKSLIQNRLISNSVIENCVPEFLMRLTDTKGEIRAAYSTLLEVVPTCVITSFAKGIEVPTPKSGRKGLEALRSSYGTWLARKNHMTKSSQATFHGHHFKAIMGFILQGYAPSKHLSDDWLERMFHSCQHRSQSQMSSVSYDNPESHPLLMSHLVGNCDAILWHWAVYESAQYCVMARLRTPLGAPADTFQVIETVLCGFAQEVEHQKTGKQIRDGPSSFSGHMGAGLGPRHYTVHLRTALLLHFMENLEKLMYNAYEGVSPMIFPTAPKPVRSFFRMNRGTCKEWLGRIRGYLVTIGNHAGMPAIAVRNGFEALNDLKTRTKSVEFWTVLVSTVKGMVSLGAWEAIRGVAVWCQLMIGTKPMWIQGAEAQAKGSYEAACEEYTKALGLLHSADDEEDDRARTIRASQLVIVEFVVNEMCECYSKVRDWREVVNWDTRVETMKKQHVEMESAFRLHCNIEQIKALSCYDTGDYGPAREFLETQDVRRDPEVFPMWDPTQLLNASKTLLLKSMVPQGGGEGSGSDETLSAADDSEFGSKSTIRRWMKLASAFTESPIRVKALDWPLHVSPVHGLQLQATAALKALSPVKSRHQMGTQSGLILHSVPTKSLDPSTQDASVWNDTLRYISYIQNNHPNTVTSSHVSPQNISQILLESVRLARRQENYKLAKILLRRHILQLTKEASSDADLSSCIMHMNASKQVGTEDKLKVMRELSKLNACGGQLPQAIETLTMSITTFSGSTTDCSNKRFGAIGAIQRGSDEGNELVSRSLLSVVKWLQTDSRLLQSIWKGENPVMQNLQTLLHMEEEVRSDGAGLFDNDLESWDLFAPEESKYERHEFAMGQLLHLAAVHAPRLAKAWWDLAGWCYRIGRKHLEAVSSSGCAELKEYEKKSVEQIVPMSVTSDELPGIYNVLGMVHAADDSAEELKETVRHNLEDELNVIRRQLLMVCPGLDKMPSLDGLITIWQGVRRRIFKHYELATRAYFKFLHLSGSHPDATPGVDDMNVTATLRLLRLLVKYAIELKSELESGFSATPTKPWKGIIPQLFSRLNHPDTNVRQSVLDLLCRVGADSPHYIIYHAVVGIMKRNAPDKRTGMSGFIGETGSESNFDSGVGVDSVGVDMYSPPDTPVSVEGDGSEQESSEGEEQSATSLEKCHQAIVDSLCSHSATVVSEVRALVTELCRVTLLWDEMWLAALMQRQGEVYRRLQKIESEARRTAALSFLTSEQKQSILKKKYDATMKPLIWLLEHLQAMTSQSPETQNERIFQATYQEIIANAIHTLKHPPSYNNPHSTWEPFKEFQQMLMLRSQKRMTSTISLHEVSPHLAAITSSSITLPGLENLADEPIVLESFDLDVMVLPTKTKPKKISMMGSDGRKHTYLFKGLEDLHLDERVMQFMAIINNMFVRDLKHQKQVYIAKDYAVTPLGARSGLIQWIDSATPLFGLYKRWQQREAYANAQLKQQSGQDGGQPLQVQILKPNELFYSKIIPLLKKNGMTEQTPRKDWPREVQRKVLEDLMNETPKDLLARELWSASTCATEWWQVTQNYTRSTAVMSIIGYIIGLGDRHLDNLLVEFATGQVIHVDYNVCFEKGKSLRVPEKVPFRMTQNIEAACGFTGVEGLFRISCEEILRILRHGRETLLTLLEAFVYDPLIDWTHSEEAAFPLAIKSPETIGLQTRKEMEREVAEGLLVTRLAEMSPHWDRCKESLIAVMSQIEEDLGNIATIGNNLNSFQDQLDSLDKQVEVLQEALHTPNHPLISMQDRLTEQNRLKTDYDRIVGVLREKYKETNEWQRKHETAFKLMHSSDFQDLCSKLHRPPDIGMAGYEIAADFLTSTGQGHTVELCKQLDHELSSQLQRRRALLNTCLEALLTYCSVTSHYPDHYPQQNRSQAWSVALARIFESDSVAPDDFQEAIFDFESALTSSAPPKFAMSVNNKLRKYIQDMYARANKLGERLRSLNSQDVNALEETVQENITILRRFFEEYGSPGAVGMACFLVMAVAPLIRRWLYMEHTAHTAAERLSDLTSKDGDWFLDELCTMSGNVLQIVDVMEMCIETINQGPAKESSLLNCSILALREVHRVYTSLQDLMGTYQLEILPKCMEYLLKEDQVFIAKLEEILSITAETQPEMSVRGLMGRLLIELKNTAMKDCSLDSSITTALQEVKTKFKVALTIDCPPEETLPPSLRVFADLVKAFDKIEDMCTFLFTALERMAAPVEWANVDLFKEAEGLLFSIPGAVLYVELFFLRKVIAIYDVCHELQMLRKSYKVEIVEDGDIPSLTPPTPPQSPVLGMGVFSTHVPSENILAQPIRRYISDTLTTHLLGQPTHTLCCITLSVLHRLGVPFENRPVLLDELCRMAHDQCQPSGISPVLHQARQLYSSSDLAWREWDKAKRLMHNLKVHREAMNRFNQITTCFQWLHEEALSQPDGGHQWVGSQRSTTLIPLKRATADQIINSVGTVREKVQSQHFRISQRLQWAACANPSLNLIFDDFERAVNNRNKALQVEEDLCMEIIDLCKTVIHLESTHSRTVIKTAYDKDIINLLSRGSEVFAQLSQCNQHLAKVSDIVPLIELPINEPVTMSWMSSRLEDLNTKRNKITKEKKDSNHKLAKFKESTLSDLEKLRGYNRNYKKLMVEIWQQLTTLGKLDPPLPHGQLNPGPRTCIGVQNRLSEGTRQLIQAANELISTDLSLAKPSLMDDACINKYLHLRDMTCNLRELLEWLLEQFNCFVQQLFSRQSTQFLPWAELPPPLLEIVVKHEKKEDKPYHIAHGVFRDPRTGKALQQQNTHAVAVWRRVKAKLDGRDLDLAYRMSVSEQVDFVIQEAISPDNLCELYEGWTPWV